MSDIAPGSEWRPRAVGPDGKPLAATVEVVDSNDAFTSYRTAGDPDAPALRILTVQWPDYFEPVY
jgi:hypothetical protein